MKLKTFTAGRGSTLEEFVNKWLNENKEIVVIEMHQSLSNEVIAFSIIYYENKKKGLPRIAERA